jgi:hypothetical protein
MGNVFSQSADEDALLSLFVSLFDSDFVSLLVSDFVSDLESLFVSDLIPDDSGDEELLLLGLDDGLA